MKSMKMFNSLIVAVYSAKKSIIERRIKEASKVARILYKSDEVFFLRFFFHITQAFS